MPHACHFRQRWHSDETLSRSCARRFASRSLGLALAELSRITAEFENGFPGPESTRRIRSWAKPLGAGLPHRLGLQNAIGRLFFLALRIEELHQNTLIRTSSIEYVSGLETGALRPSPCPGRT